MYLQFEFTIKSISILATIYNIKQYHHSGTNVDNAKQILKDSGLKITSAENLDDAAKKAVACLS